MEPEHVPARLRPGPGRAPGEVATNQKARIYRALIEIIAAEGYDALTVRRLCGAAAVSSATFYRHFDNLEDCLAEAYAAIMDRTTRRARAARDRAGGGLPGARAALRSVLLDAAQDPVAGAAALLGAYGGGPGMLLRVQAAAERFERFVAEVLSMREPLPPELLTATVAAVTRVIRLRVVEDRLDDLVLSAEPLAEWILAVCASDGRQVASLGDALLAQRSHWPAASSSQASWLEAVGDERAQLLAAVVSLAAERPYWALTPALIRAEAGVSRRSFDAHFAGVGDCFVAAARALLLGAVTQAEKQAARAASWEGGVYRRAFILLLEVGRSPALAKLGFAELLAPGRDGVNCRSEFISIGARQIRDSAPADRRPSELAAEATMAAACELVDQRVAAGERETLPRLAPLVAYLTMAPVVGASAALAAIRVEQEHLFGPLPSPGSGAVSARSRRPGSDRRGPRP